MKFSLLLLVYPHPFSPQKINTTPLVFDLKKKKKTKKLINVFFWSTVENIF